MSYWSGTIKEDIQDALKTWTPQDLDEIPIQVVDLTDDLMLDWVTGDSNEE